MKPTLYTLDLRSELGYYRTVEELQSMYSAVTLNTLVQHILTVPGNLDDEEYVWQAIESTIDENPDIFCEGYLLQCIDYWVDDMKISLDQANIKQAPHGVDPGESYFVGWVDPTTVLMRSPCHLNQN
jgi:hypothetical protein